VDRRTLYVEPAWNFRGAAEHFLAAPPDGFDFRLPSPPDEQTLGFRMATVWPVSRHGARIAGRMLPYALAVSLLHRRRPPPPGTALTYCLGQINLRAEPWVVEVEYASLLAGSHPRLLSRYAPLLERRLASDWCRGVVSWSQRGADTIVNGLESARFAQKVCVIPYAAAPAPVGRPVSRADTALKLVFFGSLSGDDRAGLYGVHDLLESFARLRRILPETRLFARTRLPDSLKRQYAGMPGLRLVETPLPAAELRRELASADLCILPYHSTTPQAILEAMHFGLPVVARDSWATPEYVTNGVTGIFIPPNPRLAYFVDETPHPAFETRRFRRATAAGDEHAVRALVDAVLRLAASPALREWMGRNARDAVESGVFSLRRRVQALNQLVDRALQGAEA